MGQVKQINIKNCVCYFSGDMECDSNLLKIDKKLYKYTNMYYIGYITVKKIDDYENIYSVNPLYLIIGKIDGFIEKKWK